MSEKGWTIAGVLLTVAFGVPAWWTLFIEHPETVTTMTWALRVATPVLTFLAGMFTGWHLRKWRSKKKSSGTGEESAEKDAEIARLAKENSSLKKQLDTQKVSGAVTALRAMAGAASRATYRSDLLDGFLGKRGNAKAPTTGAPVEQVRTPSDSRMVYSNRDDPFAALVPAEVPFLRRVYDNAQAHVGTENLLVARSLRGKGAIYRFDAPSSDFIEESNAALTKEWVPIMNKRADELRKMVEG